jgi:hypothetical protein
MNDQDEIGRVRAIMTRLRIVAANVPSEPALVARLDGVLQDLEAMLTDLEKNAPANRN